MPELLQELVDKRQSIVKELRELAELDVLDADQQQKWASLNAEFDVTTRQYDVKLKEQQSEQESRSLLEMKAAANGISTDEATSEQLAVRSAVEEYIRVGGHSMSIESRQLLKRANMTTPDAAGGYLVPEEWAAGISTAMKNFGGVRSVARSLSTGHGRPIHHPTMDDTSNVGVWVGEGFYPGDSGAGNESPPAGGSGTGASRWTQLAFEEVILNAYKGTSKIFPVSNELLQDNTYDIEGEIQRAIVTRIGRLFNSAMTTGSGTGVPQGVVTGAIASGTTASAAAGILYVDLLNTLHSVDPDYRMGSSWMMHDSIMKSIRNIQDGAGQYVWQLTAIPGQPDTLFGYPITINQDMSATSAATDEPILFGNFQYYMVRDVASIGVRRSDEIYIESDMTAFVAFMRMDARYLATSAWAAQFPVKKLVMAA